MSNYNSVYFDRDNFKMHLFDDIEGHSEHKYSYYCYKKTDEKTKFKTIYGDKVERVSYRKEMKGDPNYFEVDIIPEMRFLVDNYYDRDEIAKNIIMYLDIEVD